MKNSQKNHEKVNKKYFLFTFSWILFWRIFTVLVKIFDGNWWIYARNAVLNNLSHIFDQIFALSNKYLELKKTLAGLISMGKKNPKLRKTVVISFIVC